MVADPAEAPPNSHEFGYAQLQRPPLVVALALAGLVSLLAVGPAPAQTLLEGEFGDIDMGRKLILPDRFPTLTELRTAVRDPRLTAVLMLKLHGDGKNHHHLPIWSHDGQRLAMQRSQVGVNSSQLLFYRDLAQPEPTLLTQDPQAYDYMFRWGLHSNASFVFARIDRAQGTTRVYYSPDSEKLDLRTPGAGQNFYPALYERTDGIRWLAYEHEGRLLHQAWSQEGRVEQELAAGTSPQWSRDGQRLLMARQRKGDQVAAYDVVIRQLRQNQDLVLPSPSGAIIRSPVWSPDESHVAYYVQDRGGASAWRIVSCPVAADGQLRVLAADVVVNPVFKSEGPSWEPGSRRIWYFTHRQRRDEYYPLVAGDHQSGEELVVDYPKCCTTPNDVAINPASAVPEVAFVGHDGLSQDLFVLFLNHY